MLRRLCVSGGEMGASVRRKARGAVAAGRELPRYRVPQHWGRQLGGTLREQLAHLRICVERVMLAAALPGKGLNSMDRAILAALTLAGRAMRPREIEEQIDGGAASVNASLRRLEHCRMVVRKPLPCPRNTKAFEWSLAQ